MKVLDGRGERRAGVSVDRVGFRVGWILFGNLHAAVERKIYPSRQLGKETANGAATADKGGRPVWTPTIKFTRKETTRTSAVEKRLKGKTLDESIEGSLTL